MLGYVFLRIIQHVFSEHTTAVLYHKDQVNVHVKNTGSTASNGVVFLHRLRIIFSMKRLQAYQYELTPNGAQRRDMRRFAGACRFVFNRALAWQKDRYAADSTTKFSYTVLANFLPAWKKEKE